MSTPAQITAAFSCKDCRRNTFKSTYNYYMLKDAVWTKITKDFEGKGMLCIPCVEKRLGRELTLPDMGMCLLTSWYWRENFPEALIAAREEASTLPISESCLPY